MDFRGALQRFRYRSEQLGLAVQGVVVKVLLTLLYVFGIGTTWLLAQVFARTILKLYKPDPDAPTMWLDAEDYDPDPKKLSAQF